MSTTGGVSGLSTFRGLPLFLEPGVVDVWPLLSLVGISALPSPTSPLQLSGMALPVPGNSLFRAPLQVEFVMLVFSSASKSFLFV